jgi:hypothetical protein
MTESCFMTAEHIIRPTDHKTYRAAMRQHAVPPLGGENRMLTHGGSVAPIEMQTGRSSGGLMIKRRMERTARLQSGSE